MNINLIFNDLNSNFNDFFFKYLLLLSECGFLFASA